MWEYVALKVGKNGLLCSPLLGLVGEVLSFRMYTPFRMFLSVTFTHQLTRCFLPLSITYLVTKPKKNSLVEWKVGERLRRVPRRRSKEAVEKIDPKNAWCPRKSFYRVKKKIIQKKDQNKNP